MDDAVKTRCGMRLPAEEFPVLAAMGDEELARWMSYMVRLHGYDDDELTIETLESLAVTLESDLEHERGCGRG